MPNIKREHTAIAMLTIVSSFVAGSAFSPTKPAVSTDCNSDWMGQALESTRNAVSPPSDGGIPEGERRQMAEVFKVPASQIRLAPRQTVVPDTAPTTPSFSPSTPMPPQAQTAPTVPATIAESKGLTEQQWQKGLRKPVQPVAPVQLSAPTIRNNQSTADQQAAAIDLEIDREIARSKGVSVQEYRANVEKYAGDNVPL